MKIQPIYTDLSESLKVIIDLQKEYSDKNKISGVLGIPAELFGKEVEEPLNENQLLWAKMRRKSNGY